MAEENDQIHNHDSVGDGDGALADGVGIVHDVPSSKYNVKHKHQI